MVIFGDTSRDILPFAHRPSSGWDSQDFLGIPARGSKCIYWPGGPEVADWWPRGGELVAPRRPESDKNLSKSAQNLLGSAQDLLGPATEFQTSVTRREMSQNALTCMPNRPGQIGIWDISIGPAQLFPNRPIAAPAPFPPRNWWPRGGELVAPRRRAGGPEAAQV